MQVRHTATVANPGKEKEMRAKAEEQRIRDRENLQRRQVTTSRPPSSTPANEQHLVHSCYQEGMSAAQCQQRPNMCCWCADAKSESCPRKAQNPPGSVRQNCIYIVFSAPHHWHASWLLGGLFLYLAAWFLHGVPQCNPGMMSCNCIGPGDAQVHCPTAAPQHRHDSRLFRGRGG